MREAISTSHLNDEYEGRHVYHRKVSVRSQSSVARTDCCVPHVRRIIEVQQYEVYSNSRYLIQHRVNQQQ